MIRIKATLRDGFQMFYRVQEDEAPAIEKWLKGLPVVVDVTRITGKWATF